MFLNSLDDWAELEDAEGARILAGQGFRTFWVRLSDGWRTVLAMEGGLGAVGLAPADAVSAALQPHLPYASALEALLRASEARANLRLGQLGTDVRLDIFGATVRVRVRVSHSLRDHSVCCRTGQ